MSITKEQVADLQPGDVVELSRANGLTAKATGAVVELNRRLYVGPFMVRWQDGTVPVDLNQLNLTVVSRAPRPLYVNSDRTEPVPGDVVRGDGMDSSETWAYFGPEGAWALARTCCYADRRTMPARLRLLVDGETGQVVP